MDFVFKIARVKREYDRMKLRANEEIELESTNAVIGALKDILALTDNYFHAKVIFIPDYYFSLK